MWRGNILKKRENKSGNGVLSTWFGVSEGNDKGKSRGKCRVGFPTEMTKKSKSRVQIAIANLV